MKELPLLILPMKGRFASFFSKVSRAVDPTDMHECCSRRPKRPVAKFWANCALWSSGFGEEKLLEVTLAKGLVCSAADTRAPSGGRAR
jgi:hypothetical protein